MLSLLLRLNIEASQLVNTLRSEASQLADTVSRQKHELQRSDGQLAYLRSSESRMHAVVTVALRLSLLMNPEQLYELVWENMAVLLGAESCCFFAVDASSRDLQTVFPLMAGTGQLALVSARTVMRSGVRVAAMWAVMASCQCELARVYACLCACVGVCESVPMKKCGIDARTSITIVWCNGLLIVTVVVRGRDTCAVFTGRLQPGHDSRWPGPGRSHRSVW